MNSSTVKGVKLHALLLADAIYRDEGSGKYVIAGTFHQMNIPAFPATFGRSLGVFISLDGLDGEINLDLEFLDPSNGQVLLRMGSLSLSCEDPDLPLDFAVEVPPLPLPHAGLYVFRLLADGAVLGVSSVSVLGLPPEETPAPPGS